MKTNELMLQDSAVVFGRIPRGLDPLGAEEKLKMVPVLNQRQDVKGLVKILSSILPSIREIFNYDYYQAKAAIRDISLLMETLKNLAFEAETQVPDLSLKLKYLGDKAKVPPTASINYSF